MCGLPLQAEQVLRGSELLPYMLHAHSISRSGVHNALRDIVSRRVLPSLSPLFANQSLDAELRQALADNFPTLTPAKSPVAAASTMAPSATSIPAPVANSGMKPAEDGAETEITRV